MSWSDRNYLYFHDHKLIKFLCAPLELPCNIIITNTMNFQVKQTLRNGIGSLHKLPVYLLLTIPGKSLHRKNSYRYINHHKKLILL